MSAVDDERRLLRTMGPSGELDDAIDAFEAAIRAESAGTLDDLCSPYYERGWKKGSESAGTLDVERLLGETETLPEDAPVVGMGGQMYEAGWRERAQAIRARLTEADRD